MYKVIEIAGLLFSLFRAEDDSKLNLQTKLLILALVGSFSISSYVILEYRNVFEKGLDYKYKSVHLEAQVELLNKEILVLKEQLRAAEETSARPTVPSKSSYEHPVPTTPDLPKRKQPEAIIRERVDVIMDKING